MKRLAGTMKLDLAQYSGIESFAKFRSALDPSTTRQLKSGERTVELLKQDVYQPRAVQEQIALLKINSEGLLEDLAVDQIREFEENCRETVNVKFDEEMDALAESGTLDDAFGEKLMQTAQTVMDQITAGEES